MIGSEGFSLAAFARLKLRLSGEEQKIHIGTMILEDLINSYMKSVCCLRWTISEIIF